MLLELSITNYKSIKEKQTLSMLTSTRVKNRYNEPLNSNNIDILQSA